MAPLAFAKIGDLVKRWRVDRSSVPSIMAAHGVEKSTLHEAPRYRWSDVLAKVEGIPLHVLTDETFAKNLMSQGLLTTAQVADLLGVSSQTVRNYIACGRLEPIRLASHTPRFHPFQLCEKANEVKTEGYH